MRMRGWWWQVRGGWWDVRRWRFHLARFGSDAHGWINGHFAVRYLYALAIGPFWIERWEAVTTRLGVPRRDFKSCIREGHPGYSAIDFQWRGSWWPACSRCGGPRSFARGTVSGEQAPRPGR